MINEKSGESEGISLSSHRTKDKIASVPVNSPAPDSPPLASSRKGSIAMKPRIKNNPSGSKPILWFKKLQDVPFD